MAIIPGLERITVRTKFTPPIDLDIRGPTSPYAEKIQRVTKPSVHAQIFGQTIKIYEPYGDPSPSYFPWIVAVTIPLAVLGLRAFVRGLRK